MTEEWKPWSTHPNPGVCIEVEDIHGRLFYGRWWPETGLAYVGRTENDLAWPNESEIARWRLDDEQDC